MRRHLRTALAVLALTILCAACNVDVAIDVAMKSDGSGTVTVTATADSEIVDAAPTLVDDMRLDDVRAAGWTVQGPAATPGGGLQIVFVHPFTTPKQAMAILEGVNGISGPLKDITLDRAVKDETTTYTLGGLLQVDSGFDAFSDAELFAALGATPYTTQAAAAGLSAEQAVSVTFHAKLPGTVKTSTAKAGSASSPTGLEWSVPLDGTIVDVATVATQEDAKNIWASPLARGAQIALYVWIAASILFVVYVAISRRRRRQLRALR